MDKELPKRFYLGIDEVDTLRSKIYRNIASICDDDNVELLLRNVVIDLAESFRLEEDFYTTIGLHNYTGHTNDHEHILSFIDEAVKKDFFHCEDIVVKILSALSFHFFKYDEIIRQFSGLLYKTRL